MKYLIVLDEMQKEKLKEHILTLEGMPIIRPILKPMYVDTSGYYIYLTQDYVDALMKVSEKIVIEDAVKKATDNLLTMPKFEMEEWHSMNGVIKMPKGLFDKIYNEAKEDNDDI